MTFLCVAKIILWFLTRFKYLKILRKLFSNSLSFAVFLPIVRDITPMKQTWKKTIIVESNWECANVLFVSSALSINELLKGRPQNIEIRPIFSPLLQLIHLVRIGLPLCVQGALVIDENGTRIKYRWIWNYFVYMFNLYQT